MRTILDIFKTMHGKQFDVRVNKNGVREYYTWSISSISYEGKIVDLGIELNRSITLVSADDITIIDVVDMDAKDYARYSYISDVEKYEAAVGVKCEDLIGLSVNKFYQEINKRIELQDIEDTLEYFEPFEY